MMVEDILLGDVLGSPLMLTKLQAMQSPSAGFHEHHQASAHDYVCPSSSSVSDIGLQYDVVQLRTEQALYHTLGHNLLAFSSMVPPASVGRIVKDAALIDQNCLDNANSTSPYLKSCEQGKGGQEVDEATMLVRSLTTCSSLVESRNDDHHHALNSSYNPYNVSHRSVGCGLNGSPYNTQLECVQSHPCHDFVSENLSLILKDDFQGENYNSLIANDMQDSNTANSLSCMMKGGQNPHLAALRTSSSSSPTPSSLSASQQLARETLHASAWMGYGTSSASFNGKQSEFMSINTSVGMADVDMNNRRPNKSAIDHQQKKKRRKRKRISYKNVEEMETQRMTHITVERNRRKQMNEHLRALRLLMPQSYIQRGDQASIVGATIRFVEELEQVLQSLRLQKQLRTHHTDIYGSHVGKHHEQVDSHVNESSATTSSYMANVEVIMLTSSTFFMKVKAQREPHQLLHTLLALSNLSLRVTHLNITTIGLMMIYSFNLEMDNGDFQLLTPSQLAELIKHMLCVRSM